MSAISCPMSGKNCVSKKYFVSHKTQMSINQSMLIGRCRKSSLHEGSNMCKVTISMCKLWIGLTILYCDAIHLKGI